MNPKQLIKESGKKKTFTDDELLDLEAKYCSWGGIRCIMPRS